MGDLRRAERWRFPPDECCPSKSQAWLRHRLHTARIPAFVWNLYGTCMEFVWSLYGICMEQHAYNTQATPKQHAYNTLSTRGQAVPFKLLNGAGFRARFRPQRMQIRLREYSLQQ